MLLETAEDDPLYLVILLAAYYGLRRSEVLGIRWSAIDFDENHITINHKVIEEKVGEKYIAKGYDALKTKSSYRTLPLIGPVKKALLERKEKQKSLQKIFKSSYDKKYLEYVCVNEMGTLLRPNYVTEHFRWVLNKYLLKRIRFHDLRHTCASLLLANGVPMKAIQDWLGHSTFATTADIYSHLDFKSKEMSAKTMENLLT